MKDLRLSVKFILIFGLVVALCLFQGGLARWSADEVDRHVIEVADVRIPSLEGLLLIVDNMRRVIEIQRTLLIPSLPPERAEALLGEVATARAGYKRGFDMYEALPQTPEEAGLWKEFLEGLNRGRGLNEQFFALEKEYRQTRSQAVYDRMAGLVLGEFTEANAKTFALLEKIVGINAKVGLEAGQEAKEHSRFGKDLLLAAMAATVILVLPLAFLLARAIVVPLRRARAMAEAFARGDLSGRMKLDRRDEIGALGAAMDGMADVVSRLVGDIDAVAEETARGALRKRLGQDGLQNEFAALAGKLDAMLDGVVTLLDALPAPIMIRDAQRTMLFLNRAGGLGLADPTAMEGRKCGDHFQTDDCRNGHCACDKAVTSGTKETGTTVARPRPDLAIEIEYTAIPLTRGAVMEYVVDLSQLKAAQRELLGKAAAQLETVVESVTTAAEQLSAQVEQASRGAEVQSHRVGETATSMEEMNSTVLEVAKNASSVAGTSEQARSKAQDGSEVVEQAIVGISEVRQLSIGLKEDMTALGRQAESIGAIMNVISDIADQTNLLALNAAIEAARAGEAGRGFAVVADEVRKLAEKTMAATKEVGEAIRGIQRGTQQNIANVDRAAGKIEEATVLAGRSGESLREIVSLVDLTTDQVRSIATASEQQSATSEEINRAIDDVNRISSETADAMRQSEQAVLNLSEQAQALQRLILDIQTEAGGSAAAGKVLPGGRSTGFGTLA